MALACSSRMNSQIADLEKLESVHDLNEMKVGPFGRRHILELKDELGFPLNVKIYQIQFH